MILNGCWVRIYSILLILKWLLILRNLNAAAYFLYNPKRKKTGKRGKGQKKERAKERKGSKGEEQGKGKRKRNRMETQLEM